MQKYTVLVADDDREIVEAISIYLRSEGYDTLAAYDGVQALEAVTAGTVHLAVLDVMMPRMDGLRAAAEIRRSMNLPIIFLSAKSEDTDKILGLNMGADDYVTKPFNPVELMARVRAQLRRYTVLGRSPETEDGALATGGLELRAEEKTVFADGEEVRLTPIEFKILRLLMKNPGRLFSIDEIYERVWNEPNYSAENTVAVHIQRLRQKIEINPKEPKYLKVVWGIGYKIEKIPVPGVV